MKIRRKKYVINKPLQFIYSGIMVYLLLISIIVIGATTYHLTFSTILNELEAQGGYMQMHEVVKSVNLLLLKRVGVILIGMLLFAFGIGIYYLHRIAGPIFRIEKTLMDMAEGRKADPIKLRKKDFFKTLADVVNKLIEKQNS